MHSLEAECTIYFPYIPLGQWGQKGQIVYRRGAFAPIGNSESKEFAIPLKSQLHS